MPPTPPNPVFLLARNDQQDGSGLEGKERWWLKGRVEPLVMWSLPAEVRKDGAKVEKEDGWEDGRQWQCGAGQNLFCVR